MSPLSRLRALLPFFLVAVASIGFVQGFAWADTPADPSTNPSDSLGQFWAAVTAKRWGIAAVIGTMLLVAFVRFIAPRVHGKFGAWINTTRASAGLAFLSGGLMAVATQLLKGGAFSPQLLVYGFGFGVAAIGGYNAFWDILFPSDKKPATSAPLELPPPVRAGGSSGKARFVVLMALALGGFLVACTMSGCAPGTDGLRQSCANANVTLSSATMASTAVYKVAHQELRARLTKENADATAALAKKYDAAFDKFIATMTAAAAVKKTTCDQADTVDAGIKHDVGALILQMIQFANDVATAVMEFQKAIDAYRPVALLLMEVA